MSEDEESEDVSLRSRGDAARERKAEETRLSALATALVGLSNKQLRKLAMEEPVVDAVEEARRMKSHGARARQLRIVRRALRGSGSVELAEAVDELIRPSGRPSRTHREASAWVDRFYLEGSAAVESFVTVHEHADRQQLKKLLRNLQKAADTGVGSPEATQADMGGDPDAQTPADAPSEAVKADRRREAKARKMLIAAVQSQMRP